MGCFKRKCQKNKRYHQLYLLALIPFLFVLVFSYIPMGGILLAFKDFSIRKGIFKSPWAGLKYFRQLYDSHFSNYIEKYHCFKSGKHAVWFPLSDYTCAGFQ